MSNHQNIDIEIYLYGKNSAEGIPNKLRIRRWAKNLETGEKEFVPSRDGYQMVINEDFFNRFIGLDDEHIARELKSIFQIEKKKSDSEILDNLAGKVIETVHGPAQLRGGTLCSGPKSFVAKEEPKKPKDLTLADLGFEDEDSKKDEETPKSKGKTKIEPKTPEKPKKSKWNPFNWFEKDEKPTKLEEKAKKVQKEKAKSEATEQSDLPADRLNGQLDKLKTPVSRLDAPEETEDQELTLLRSNWEPIDRLKVIKILMTNPRILLKESFCREHFRRTAKALEGMKVNYIRHYVAFVLKEDVKVGDIPKKLRELNAEKGASVLRIIAHQPSPKMTYANMLKAQGIPVVSPNKGMEKGQNNE